MRFKVKARRVIRTVQGLGGLRNSDIMLVSFPKSGNTWVRYFLCQLMNVLDGKDERVDFARLNEIMPEFGRSNLFQRWPSRSLDRFVKTHAGYHPLLRGRRVVLVVRDPRDVLVSLHHFETHRIETRVPDDLSRLMRHRRYGFEGWFKHTLSWLGRATVVVRYEDLRHNDVLEFSRMLTAVGQSVPTDAIRKAAERSRFREVRQIEQEQAATPAGFRTTFRFAREGEIGTGRRELSEEDCLLYERLRQKYGLHLY